MWTTCRPRASSARAASITSITMKGSTSPRVDVRIALLRRCRRLSARDRGRRNAATCRGVRFETCRACGADIGSADRSGHAMAARATQISPEDERSWRLNEAAPAPAAAAGLEPLCRNDTGQSRPPRERTARVARPRPALRRVGRAWTGRAASRGAGADRRRPAAAVAASARRPARPEAPVRDPARDEGPMRRADVAHILRASRSLTNETEFVLVGSQSGPACRSPTFRRSCDSPASSTSTRCGGRSLRR